MERRATLLKKSRNGRKSVYIDDENAEEILSYLKAEPGNLKKFWMIVELILEGKPTRDLYDKENFEKGCEHVAAMKLFKGKKNPRIYCQHYSHKEKSVYVIVASELLIKKKSQGLSKKEKSIIRRVAKYQYKLDDGKK